MATHGFSPAAITAFGQPEVEYYYLVRIDFSVPVFFTLAPFDILNNIDGETYNSDGLVLSVPDIIETLKITPTTIGIEMSGASTIVHALTVTEQYRNADVYIYLHEVCTGETKQVFKGYLDSFQSDNDDLKGESKVIWKVANHWTNWKAKAGRFISNRNQLLLYGNDFGLLYASYANKTDILLGHWGSVIYTNTVFSKGVKAKALEGGEDFYERLPLVYGQRSLEGTRVFSDFGGAFLSDLIFRYDHYWEVWVLAEGECDALVDVTFDGESYLSAKLSPFVDITFHSGIDLQPAAPEMLAVDFFFNNWTTLHQLRNITYVSIKYTKSEVWGTGAPSKPVFTIRGKKVFDPRNSQTVYSENNALVLHDFVTSSLYGKGIDPAILKEFSAGADYADVQKEAFIGAGFNISTFAFNGFIDTSRTIKDIAEEMLFTMRAHLPYINGEYVLVIETEFEFGAYVIDADNIKGKFKVFDGGMESLSNTISYDYVGVDENGVETDEQIIVDSQSYIDEDNGRIIKQNVSNKNETNGYRAENRANTLLKKSREQIRVKCSLYSMDSISVEAGNIVNITDSLRGWILKQFRVEIFKLLKEETYLELREYEPSVNAWYMLPESTNTVNSLFPSVFEIEPVTNLVLLSDDTTLFTQADKTVVPRIKVTFDPPYNIFNLSGYKIYSQNQSIGEAEYLYRTITDINQTEVMIDGVNDGSVYRVGVVAFNEFTEAEKVTQFAFASAKQGAPNPPTFLIAASIEVNIANLSWTASPDGDIEAYEIWASVDIFQANAELVGETTADIANIATALSRWYWVRARDTSGNISDFEPINPNAGVLVTPDGLTSVAVWEAITGKPNDSRLLNIGSMRNGFEDDEFSLWINTSSTDFVVQHADSFSGSFAGLFTSTATTEPSSAGLLNDTPHFLIPEELVLAFEGKRIRVTLYAKKPSTNAAASFSVCYSTNGAGNSGWQSFIPAENASGYSAHSFVYNVSVNPILNNGAIGIWGDDTLSAVENGVLIDSIIIEVLEATLDELTEIADSVIITFYQETEPTTGMSTNDYWINTLTNELHRYDGGVWNSVQDDDILNALLQAGDAQATADGKIVTFVQAATPTSEGIGDLWMDTGNGNIMYRAANIGVSYIGTGGWEQYRDIGIATSLTLAGMALVNAATAQSTADGKIVTFVKDYPPPISTSIGDLWFNSSDENRLYHAVIEGAVNIGPTEWADARDGGISQATIDAANALIIAADAEALADTKIVTFVQDAIPTSDGIGDLWMDTGSGNLMYRSANKGISYIGTGGWEEYRDVGITTALSLAGTALANAATAQSTADGKVVTFIKDYPPPTSVSIGDLWFNSSDINHLYHATSTGATQIAIGQWEDARDGGISQATIDAANALLVAADAEALADSKIVTFVQDAIPTSDGVGDLWMDTNDNNKIYRSANKGISYIGTGGWEEYAQDYAIWSKIFDDDGNKPADNADITNYLDYRVANDRVDSSVTNIKRPVGASYYSGSNVNGAIIINLPRSWGDTSIKFMVDIVLQSSTDSFSIGIGGFMNNTSNQWNSEFVQVFGSIVSDNRVRFAHNGAVCCLIIGETNSNWAKPVITVRDVVLGGLNDSVANWDDNWNVFLTSSLGGYTVTGDISDALIDAHAINGTGVVATDHVADEAITFHRYIFYAIGAAAVWSGAWTTSGSLGLTVDADNTPLLLTVNFRFRVITVTGSDLCCGNYRIATLIGGVTTPLYFDTHNQSCQINGVSRDMAVSFSYKGVYDAALTQFLVQVQTDGVNYDGVIRGDDIEINITGYKK